MGLIIHVDGGSRGNPGPAGAGVVIEEDGGGLVHEGGYFLGHQTNNAAEYHACIRALQRVARCAPAPVRVCSDSELLVRQITGQYRVKNANLERLYEQVQVLLIKLPRWQFQHVPREQNRRADQLANMAMDAQADVIVFDIETGGAPPSAVPPTGNGANEGGGPSTTAPAQASVTAVAEVVAGARQIRVEIAAAPTAAVCAAGGFTSNTFVVDQVVPGGWCVHAAHAILPTLLAMKNTEPQEFAAIPAMTLRCMKAGCNATFRLLPRTGENGRQPDTTPNV